MSTDAIAAFLDGDLFAVAGASNDRSKFGNKVLRHYNAKGKRAFPIHPTQTEVEGLVAYPSVADLPEPVHGLSIVTPPQVTATIVDQAIDEGIKHIWMQPGAEHEGAIARAKAAGVSVIAYGPCVLVEL